MECHDQLVKYLSIRILQELSIKNRSFGNYYFQVWILKTTPFVIVVTRLMLLSDVTLHH